MLEIEEDFQSSFQEAVTFEGTVSLDDFSIYVGGEIKPRKERRLNGSPILIGEWQVVGVTALSVVNTVREKAISANMGFSEAKIISEDVVTFSMDVYSASQFIKVIVEDSRSLVSIRIEKLTPH